MLIEISSDPRRLILRESNDFGELIVTGDHPDPSQQDWLSELGIHLSPDARRAFVPIALIEQLATTRGVDPTWSEHFSSITDRGVPSPLDDRLLCLEAETHWNGPLTGIRVVELATVLMAPYAAQILGDFGADVIKVEGYHDLDSSRVMGGGPHPDLSGVALNLHRNKRSVQLDLKSSEGREAMEQLLDTADVFLTNLRPSSLAKLGLDFETMTTTRPRLVYAEAHGYGAPEADRDRPAFDDIIQAATGLPSMVAEVDGEPRYFPMVIADKISGVTLAMGVLGALVHRASTDKGQRVEVPMFDSVLAFNLVEHLAQATTPGGAPYYTRTLSKHRGPFKTKDGYIAVLPYSDKNWRALYRAVGKEEILDEPEFADRRSRHENSNITYASLAEILRERTTDEWLQLCSELGVAAGRVETIADIVNDPRKHRGVLRESEHPVVGPYFEIKPPIQFSNSPLSVRHSAPLVGEHTTEILRDLDGDEDLATGRSSAHAHRRHGVTSDSDT